MTFFVSFGKWGGVYVYRSDLSWRLCVGWVAFTIMWCDYESFTMYLVEKIQDLEGE